MKHVTKVTARFVSPRNQNQAPQDGFTLIEVLVTVAIVAMLAAIAFPAFKSSFASAKNAKCVSNLRQIGVGMSLYVADYN